MNFNRLFGFKEWLITCLCGISFFCFSQETIVKGKVTDANSGDPIPFVNIVFKGTSIGTTTDFEGNYLIQTNNPTDSLLASYIGYKPRSKRIVRGISQTVNFQLEEEVTRLKELVFLAGENPAFEILRRVVRNKDKNDKRNLTAYEYDTYSKIEIDIDNITDRFRRKKFVQKITSVLDSIQVIAGEDGNPVLPVFISESVSRFYYRSNPDLEFENIKETKISGVGVEDGSMIAQVLGASFQEYNFFKNWLNIVSKDFISPIADGWRLYYDYDLMDSLYIGDDYCYRLDFYPKSPQDLAFTGTMWITKNEYALKQIEATVGKSANLNYVEKIKIQQELANTESGAWLPVKNRVLVDIGEVNDKWAGLLAKFYTSNRNIVINQPREPKFYEKQIVLEEDYKLRQDDDEYWNTLRHDTLTQMERTVYRMIDTLQNIPVVRTYIDIIKLLVNGYKKAGKIDVGPYLSLIAGNNIEGVRVQGGFKTNIHFSNKWVFGGQLGYGFKDDKIKYAGFVQNIMDRKHWTTVSFRARSDIGRVGIDDESLADDYLYLASTRWGFFRKAYYFDEARLNFQREIYKGYSQRIALRYNEYRPYFDFKYPVGTNDSVSNFQTSEIIFESRFARDELFIQNDNERISLGATKWPIITIRYVHGFKGIAGGDFEYDRLRLTLRKRFQMAMLGTGYATLSGEYVFNKLPYFLLPYHLGNQSVFYTDIVYNLMNYGEFISDHFASLQYRQHFEGLLLNRIPVMRKLKWRLTGLANVIYGGLREENRFGQEESTTPVSYNYRRFSSDKPYIELGYGVENIFKLLRVDFIHRLTYLDEVPGIDKPRPFGILFTVVFQL